MKKILFTLFTLTLFSAAALFTPLEAHAANFQDGTYDVSYEIKDASGNSTSIADGYFLKPAKVTVENGTYYAQFTVKNAEWIKSVSGPHGSASVVSEDKANDQKVLKLQVSDISSPVDLSMHIVVPEDVAGMEYDNNHKAKAVFQTDNIPTASSESEENQASDTNNNEVDEDDAAGTVAPEDNPKTGDEAPILLFGLLAALSLLFLVFRNKIFTQENEKGSV